GYNERLPYAAQVKPFGFMLRFYASQNLEPVAVEATTRKHTRPPAPPKPIAPYDKDAARASNHCFDRATGKPVPRNMLASYRDELAQYHLHPDSKFLHAEYRDQGLTGRKHVQVRDVSYIGKEADHLEEQLDLGFDPDAVIHYDAGAQ